MEKESVCSIFIFTICRDGGYFTFDIVIIVEEKCAENEE